MAANDDIADISEKRVWAKPVELPGADTRRQPWYSVLKFERSSESYEHQVDHIQCHWRGDGYRLVATVYAALDRQLISGSALPVVVAGGWEGLCLGSAQAWILRNAGIEPKRWIVLTVIGAFLGYGLSLLGGAGQAELEDQAEPAIGLIVLLGAALGFLMGALMGSIQSIGAGGIMSRKRWILANVIGWAPAMAVIMFGASAVDRSMSLGAIALAGAASGGLAGALLGAITQTALPKIKSEQL